MAYSPEIVTYANDLYNQYNELGKQKYQKKEILKKINSKFKKKVSAATLNHWIYNYKWRDKREELKQMAINKANKNVFVIAQMKASQQKNSDILSALLRQSYLIYTASATEIKNHFGLSNDKPATEITMRDLIALSKTSTDTIFRIYDMPSKNDSETTLTPEQRKDKIKELHKYANNRIA